MAETKTKATKASVNAFIAGLENPTRRADAKALLALFKKATGWKPQMWGPTIVGFGRYSYVYESGHSGEACVCGFSPRTANLVIYSEIEPKKRAALLARLGKHKVSRGGCIYINKLADVDLAVLEKVIKAGVARMKKTWPVAAA